MPFVQQGSHEVSIEAGLWDESEERAPEKYCYWLYILCCVLQSELAGAGNDLCVKDLFKSLEQMTSLLFTSFWLLDFCAAFPLALHFPQQWASSVCPS